MKKHYVKFIVFVIVYFTVWAAAVFLIGNKLTESTAQNRVTFMNRMTAQINETGDTIVHNVRMIKDDASAHRVFTTL